MKNLLVLFLFFVSLKVFALAPEIVGHTPAYTLKGGCPVYTGFFCNNEDDEAGIVTIKAGYGNEFQVVKVDGEEVLKLDSEVAEVEVNLSKYLVGYERENLTHLLQLTSLGGTSQGELYFCKALPEIGGCVLLVPTTYEGTVIGFDNRTKNVWIPTEYWVTEEYSMPITSVSSNAFLNATEMETLHIPSEISSLQYDAFIGCTNLSDVFFEDSNIALKITNAHMLAPNLFPDSPVREIYMGRNITNTSGTVTNPFYGLDKLETIDFGSSPIKLGCKMFANCSSLKEITIPKNVIWDEGTATSGTNHEGLFSGCSSLESATILTEEVSSTANNMFFDCIALKQVNLPTTIQLISGSTFCGCESLTKLPIDSLTSLNTIGQYAFAGCNGLEYIEFPESVETIDKRAFNNCQNLATVIFPNTLSALGDDCFAHCNNILEVFYLTGNKMMTAESPYIFEDRIYSYATLYVLNNQIDAIAGNPWNKFSKVEGCENDRLPFIKFSTDSIETPLRDESKKIKINYVVIPQVLADNDITWESSDSAVAEVVQENGEYFIVISSVGNAEISASLSNGNNARCNIEVMPVWVETLSITPYSIEAVKGETIQLTAVVLPEDATDKTLEWNSSNDEIATVDETGLVTVLEKGDCTITARTTDGSDLSAECHISITTGVEEIDFDESDLVDVYTLDGVKIKADCKRNNLDDLTSGIYLLRKYNKVEKLIIR